MDEVAVMAAKFQATARVGDDGSLLHGDRVELRAWLKENAGQTVTLTIEKKRKPRSHDQLEWLFGVAYPAIAREAGYDLHELHDKATLENLHDGLLEQCYGATVDKVTGKSHPKERTTGKSAGWTSEYMSWVSRYAAIEYRLDIPLPDEWREKQGVA